MKCFVCGAEYDNKNKEIACNILDRNEKMQPIRSIRFIPFNKEKEETLRLCKNCVQAVTIGAFLATRCVNIRYYGHLETEEEYIAKQKAE